MRNYTSGRVKNKNKTKPHFIYVIKNRKNKRIVFEKCNKLRIYLMTSNKYLELCNISIVYYIVYIILRLSYSSLLLMERRRSSSSRSALLRSRGTL